MGNTRRRSLLELSPDAHAAQLGSAAVAACSSSSFSFPLIISICRSLLILLLLLLFSPALSSFVFCFSRPLRSVHSFTDSGFHSFSITSLFSPVLAISRSVRSFIDTHTYARSRPTDCHGLLPLFRIVSLCLPHIRTGYRASISTRDSALYSMASRLLT